MSFKFNFGKEAVPNAAEKSFESAQDAEFLAEEVFTDAQVQQMQSWDDILLTPQLSLLKGNIPSQKASIMLSSGDLVVSDLVPRKYEGGFKLWECAIDLASHLCKHWQISCGLEDLQQTSHKLKLAGKQALELGCGHGLPGILASLLGMEVHFQDYNKDVLTGLTIPNLSKNTARLPEGSSKAVTRFFSGGWGSLRELLQSEGLSQSYDFVFSTDTIYSLDSQQQLLDCISEALKSGGTAFIAAKSYYFGVGGSSEGFKELVKQSGLFDVKTGAEYADGSSNRREIFLLVKR